MVSSKHVTTDILYWLESYKNTRVCSERKMFSKVIFLEKKKVEKFSISFNQAFRGNLWYQPIRKVAEVTCQHKKKPFWKQIKHFKTWSCNHRSLISRFNSPLDFRFPEWFLWKKKKVEKFSTFFNQAFRGNFWYQPIRKAAEVTCQHKKKPFWTDRAFRNLICDNLCTHYVFCIYY